MQDTSRGGCRFILNRGAPEGGHGGRPMPPPNFIGYNTQGPVPKSPLLSLFCNWPHDKYRLHTNLARARLLKH